MAKSLNMEKQYDNEYKDVNKRLIKQNGCLNKKKLFFFFYFLSLPIFGLLPTRQSARRII